MAGLRQPDQNGMDRTLARMPPGNQAYLAARGIPRRPPTARPALPPAFAGAAQRALISEHLTTQPPARGDQPLPR